jgi:hypothetical protein
VRCEAVAAMTVKQLIGVLQACDGDDEYDVLTLVVLR